MDTKRIIAELSRRLGREEADVAKLLDAVGQVMREMMLAQDSVAIPGFGMFAAQKHAERVTTDPVTGRRTLLPPRVDVAFTPSSLLKSRLSNPK